jgi:hypothetical protein
VGEGYSHIAKVPVNVKDDCLAAPTYFGDFGRTGVTLEYQHAFLTLVSVPQFVEPVRGYEGYPAPDSRPFN